MPHVGHGYHSGSPFQETLPPLLTNLILHPGLCVPAPSLLRALPTLLLFLLSGGGRRYFVIVFFRCPMVACGYFSFPGQAASCLWWRGTPRLYLVVHCAQSYPTLGVDTVGVCR